MRVTLRLYFILIICIIHSIAFSQTKNEDSNFLNSNKDKIIGIYKIELYEGYDDKGELYFSTFFEGKIIIKENANSVTANKIGKNEPYFNISKDGSNYNISNGLGQVGSFNIELFNNSEIKLKLINKNKSSSNYYSIYTLRRITDIKELFKNIIQGTGFFISSNGYALTNYHVIANSQYITINIGVKEYDCEPIFKNEIDDIAIIRIKDTSLQFSSIPFSSKSLEVGDEVIALGFPLASTMGKELKISSGIINSNKGFQDDARYFQFSAPIDPGNSGGPVLDKTGNLIGLITAKYNSATNAGYALKLTDIIKSIPKTIKFKIELKPQNISNSVIYSKYKSSVVLIKSYSL